MAAIEGEVETRAQRDARLRSRSLATRPRGPRPRPSGTVARTRPSTPSPRSVGAGAAAGAAGGPAGAILGAASQTRLSASKRRELRRERIADRPGPQRLLVAEFVLTVIIMAFSPVTDKHRDATAATMIKRLTAASIWFLVLGLVASIGPGAAKAAAGLGGLTTLVLLISERDIFAVLAARMGADTSSGPAGPPSAPVPDLPGGGVIV
jgi:hypothetical protein